MARISVRTGAIIAVVVLAAAAVASVVFHRKNPEPVVAVESPPVTAQQVKAIAGEVNDNVGPELTKLGAQHNDLVKAHNELKAKLDAHEKAFKEQPVLTPEQVRGIAREELKGVREAVPPSEKISALESMEKQLKEKVGEIERNFLLCSAAA